MMESKINQNIVSFARRSGVPVKIILDFLFNQKKVKIARSIVEEIKREKIDSLTLDFKNYLPQDQFYEFLKNDHFKESLEILKKYQKYSPTPNRKLDQFIASTETVAKRASLLNFLKDLEGKKILFLGDDDFTSVAIAKFRLAEEVVALDLDDRILHSIKNISNIEKLNIETFKYDAKNAVPDKLSKKYDVIFTDPPYTMKGFSLFLSRALDLLNFKSRDSRIYICFGNSDKAKERFLPIYDCLQKSGLMIRFAFDKFNIYSKADSIGNTSTLFVCDITPKVKSLIKGNFQDDIYTG